MQTTTFIIFIIFLAIGTLSILMLSGVYLLIIYKNRKIDAIFHFQDHASKKEIIILRTAVVGLIATLFLFLFL